MLVCSSSSHPTTQTAQSGPILDSPVLRSRNDTDRNQERQAGSYFRKLPLELLEGTGHPVQGIAGRTINENRGHANHLSNLATTWCMVLRMDCGCVGASPICGSRRGKNIAERLRWRWRARPPSAHSLDVAVRVGFEEQALVLDADEFFVRNNPLRRHTPATFLFLGADTAESAPFTDGELGFAKKLGRLGRRVPFLQGSLLEE